MITKKTEKVATVRHAETGFVFDISQVDCFVERVSTTGIPEFIFHQRYYETSLGDKAIKKNDKIWIVQTGVNNWYVEVVG